MRDIEIHLNSKELPELKLGQATLNEENYGFLSYCFECKREGKIILITLEYKLEKHWWN